MANSIHARAHRARVCVSYFVIKLSSRDIALVAQGRGRVLTIFRPNNDKKKALRSECDPASIQQVYTYTEFLKSPGETVWRKNLARDNNSFSQDVAWDDGYCR